MAGSDEDHVWRIVYYVGEHAIVILDVFAKRSRRTPKRVLDACSKRLARYRQLTEREDG